MTEREVYDITIIGGGPVGLFAAFCAGMRSMSTKIIDSLPELGGQLSTLYPEKYVYDMPGFPRILARELVQRMVEQALRFHPTVCLDEEALELKQVGENWRIITDKAEHDTRTVLIAVGAGAFHPRKLQLPGVEEYEGRSVFYFVREKEAFAGKRVLIVGGGDSAVDWALTLLPIARHITLIHRRDVFRAHEGNVQMLFRSPVEVKLFWELKALHGENGNLRAVTIFNNRTMEEQRLEVDAAVISIGFNADVGAVRNWGLDMEDHLIRVDHFMRTNLPGVFAAGDVVTYPGKLRLIATGVGEAAIAVNSAKRWIDPTAQFFPGHSSDMKL
ncbi:Ferredoxin--NADP reductase 2 [bacterium HR16]|nr:Ferredoxin--NADP reductase 2 [bacterium HR16]